MRPDGVQGSDTGKEGGDRHPKIRHGVLIGAGAKILGNIEIGHCSRVAACSVITNLAAGMTGGELSHQETKDIAPVGGARLATMLKHAFLEGLLDG